MQTANRPTTFSPCRPSKLEAMGAIFCGPHRENIRRHHTCLVTNSSRIAFVSNHRSFCAALFLLAEADSPSWTFVRAAASASGNERAGPAIQLWQRNGNTSRKTCRFEAIHHDRKTLKSCGSCRLLAPFQRERSPSGGRGRTSNLRGGTTVTWWAKTSYVAADGPVANLPGIGR
jgi:hypothetical protein